MHEPYHLIRLNPPLITCLLESNLSFSEDDLETVTTQATHLNFMTLVTHYSTYSPPKSKLDMDFYATVQLNLETPLPIQPQADKWNTTFWNPIHNTLRLESPIWTTILTTPSRKQPYNKTPLSLLWARVCDAFNLDILEMNRVIAHVVSPSTVTLPDVSIMEFVRLSDPVGLARRLKKDMLIIPLELDMALGKDMEVIFDVVAAMQELLFDLR
jgi:hypothetical protein